MQSLRIASFRPLGFPWIFARFPFPLEGTDLGQFAKKIALAKKGKVNEIMENRKIEIRPLVLAAKFRMKIG